MHSELRRYLRFAGILLIIGITTLIYFNPYPPKGKIARASVELRLIHREIDQYRDALLTGEHLDNKKFVEVTGLRVEKSLDFDDKGQLLDPWGQPYVISRDNGQINVKSFRFDQYQRRSGLQKWWRPES